MDLGIITVPLMTLLIAFGFAVLTDTQTVHFEYVDVPDHIAAETGYTSAVIITKLADEMQQIEKQASSRAEGRKVVLNAEKSATSVLGEFMGVKPLIRVVQELASMISFSFSGEIVAHGHDAEFTLRGYDAHHNQSRFSVHGNTEHMQELIHKTAFEAMRVVNAYILAAYQFRRDRLTRDFTPTLEIIQRELAGHDQRYAKFLHNLWGMVLYQQADRDGAIEQFKAASQLDHEFLSPLLNWGVVLARQGKHSEAIAKFNEVVASHSAVEPENAATIAAAYSEWGFSLALSNKPEEAYLFFDRATKIDPTFSDVYSTWAEVLSAQGRAEDAAQMTARALKLAPEEIVYTENLVGAVQSLPAVAN